MSSDSKMIDDTQKSAAEILRTNGCCAPCILRFLGHRNVADYRTNNKINEVLHQFLKEDILDGPLSKKERLNPCIQCLGILTDLCPVIIDNVKTVINNSDFEYTDFLLSVSTPSCCLIRENVTQSYMKQHFKSLFASPHFYIPSIKDVLKWIIGPAVEEEFHITFNVHSHFDVTITIEFSDDKDECFNLFNLHGNASSDNVKSKRSLCSRGSVEKFLSSIPPEDILKKLDWPPSIPSVIASCGKIDCSRKSFYLAGRYNKYSRNLSQTPWMIDGEKLMESSIKEIICDLLMVHIKADDVKFSASGREDVDVRTLGKGRPFVLEFINPRKVTFDKQKMKIFQKEINTSTTDIAVRDLQIVSKDEVIQLKDGEEEKTKVYTALCSSKEPISRTALESLQHMKELVIDQKTPIRVLHRRPFAIRKRVIHEMQAQHIDQFHFKLHLKTQAGTYIKEFVHGDFGRTCPNIRTLLGCQTDILELDVEAVELDWPPSTEEYAS